MIADAEQRLREYRWAATEEAEIRSKIGERNSQRCFFRLPSRFDDFAAGTSYGYTQTLEEDITTKEARRSLRKKGRGR